MPNPDLHTLYILSLKMELGHGLNQHRINCSLKDTVYANQEESTFDMLKKTQKSGFILIILEERQFINYYLPTAIVFMEIECHKSSLSFIWQKIQ